MAWNRDSGRFTRWVMTVVTLVVVVAALTVVLNSGGAGREASPDASAPVDAGAPQQTKADTALVSRVLDDLRAGKKPEQQDQPVAGAPVKLVRAGPENPAPTGRLSIPAIGLRTPVFEGVYENALRDGPGHWPGTPAPGEAGNTVLSGHRSTETRPFLYLDKLSAGDVITITEGRERFRYAVDAVTIVPEKGYVRYVLQEPAKPKTRMLTLFACNPLTAHYQRIVVRARALDSRGQS